MGSKIINTALLTPGSLRGPSFRQGGPNLQLKMGQGGPNVMGALIFYDTSVTEIWVSRKIAYPAYLYFRIYRYLCKFMYP